MAWDPAPLPRAAWANKTRAPASRDLGEGGLAPASPFGLGEGGLAPASPFGLGEGGLAPASPFSFGIK